MFQEQNDCNIRESGLTWIYMWAYFVIIKFLKQANTSESGPDLHIQVK